MASAATPGPTTIRPGETLDYQPVAPAAVLAMVVAGGFTLAVAVLVVVGLTSRKPVIVWELLVVAFLGVCLSIVGRLQIRNAEGTRTGLNLTVIAWWLSILGGVGYGAYILAMEQSIRRQGQDYAKLWLDELKKPDQNVAFVMTLEPARRARLNPSDETALRAEQGGAPLSGFRANDFTRMFARVGDSIRYEFVGVRDWKPSKVGYEMAQTWRIISPEGTVDVSLGLTAIDNRETVSREWLIVPPGESGYSNPHRTAWGRASLEILSEASSFGRNWATAFAARQDELALQSLLAPESRVDLEPRRNPRQAIGGGLSAALQPAAYPKDLAADFLKLIDQTDATKESERRALFQKIFEKHSILPGGTIGRGNPADAAPTLVENGDELAFRVPLDMLVPKENSRPVFAKGSAIVRSENPEFDLWLKDLRQRARANPEIYDATATALLATAPERRLRIVRLESDMELNVTTPGGPPGR